MNTNRFAKTFAVLAGLIFLYTASAGALSAASDATQPPRPASRGTHPKAESLPEDDFAGLNYTDEQRGEIDKIHRETESHKATVAKDEKLTADPKGAMILGYTRMEYVAIFKILSPEQQKQVRQRITARRAADNTAPRRSNPPG